MVKQLQVHFRHLPIGGINLRLYSYSFSGKWCSLKQKCLINYRTTNHKKTKAPGNTFSREQVSACPSEVIVLTLVCVASCGHNVPKLMSARRIDFS